MYYTHCRTNRLIRHTIKYIKETGKFLGITVFGLNREIPFVYILSVNLANKGTIFFIRLECKLTSSTLFKNVIIKLGYLLIF